MTFKHSKRWYFFAQLITAVLGVLFAFIPAVIAVIVNFPVMVTKNSDSTVSMLFIVALLIAAIALLYFVVKVMKKNPFLIIISALAIITLVLLGVYHMEKDTILGLCYVAATATGGCVISAICFALHKMWRDLYENCGQVYGEIETK